MMDWAGQLNLTPEQSAEIRELRGAYLRDTMAWRNELVIKRFDLRDLLRNPDSDPNAILAKQKELSELEAKIQERGLLLHLQMRQVLTPEQMKLLPPQWEGVPGRAMRPGLRRGREY
jgi:Spy/CpxP family protein refolding chaperone